MSLLLAVLALSCVTLSAEQPLGGKKILYIDSYHEGWPWNARIADGIRRVLRDTGVELRIVYMDTKRNPSEEFKVAAGQRVRDIIETFHPDVVIASDDNAAKYVVSAYYLGSTIPFVFCGINWNPGQYGLPASNVTGMVEVNLVDKMVRQLAKYSAGSGRRIGYLASDTYTERQDGKQYRILLGPQLTEELYVRSFPEWERLFAEIQERVDVLIVGTPGLADFDWSEAERFALEHTRVPTGTMNDFIMPVALLGYLKVPEEFGVWSAQTALTILRGTPASEIPVVTNRRFELILNLKVADRLGIVFSTNLLKNAEIIR